MRRALEGLSLAAALLLSACATSKERVTLLDPAETPGGEGSSMGSLVVEHDGEETVIDTANQQAQLKGDNRRPRVVQLDERDPFHSDVMDALPKGAQTETFYFAHGEDRLSEADADALLAWLTDQLEGREGVHIEIAAHTDATGSEEFNQDLSSRRAGFVRDQIVQRIRDQGRSDIAEDNIEPYPSGWHWARSNIAEGEGAQSDPRYRVVVVTIR